MTRCDIIFLLSGRRIMANTPAFQASNESSIPSARTKLNYSSFGGRFLVYRA